jgi:transcriptional regulator with XRE-family HTH domain
MTYSTEHIVGALKAARQQKGLSQRELSAKAGVPQGHISKIENGAVDLKLSSLIALARILDLEIMAVPRRLVPAVQALARTGDAAGAQTSDTARLAAKHVRRIEKAVTRLAAGKTADSAELERLRRAARELSRLPVGAKELESLRRIAAAFGKREQGQAQKQEIADAAASLERAWSQLVRRMSQEPARAPRPAYALEDGDDDA